jgi:hypothetical protein
MTTSLATIRLLLAELPFPVKSGLAKRAISVANAAVKERLTIGKHSLIGMGSGCIYATCAGKIGDGWQSGSDF